MEVGRKISEYLNSKGISQAYLGRESGIPTARLNLILNGKRKLSVADYEAICGVLGVPVDQFLEPRTPAR